LIKINNLLLIIIYLILSTAGVLLIKIGLNLLSNKSEVNYFINVIRNRYLIFGIILYILSFATWLFILSDIKLTIIYPTIIGLSILLITIGSIIFLKETIGLYQGIGIGLLIVAINMILYGK